MSVELIHSNPDAIISPGNRAAWAAAGTAANKAAAQATFTDYQREKAENTIRRQTADLELFTRYLESFGLMVGELMIDPEAWKGITWGLVAGFTKWQLDQGYSIGSINVRTSTVKNYARLALKAGALSESEYAMIATVSGYSFKESVRIDIKRKGAEIPIRVGSKKAHPVTLTHSQAMRLLEQPVTPQGRRDTLLLVLMMDLGLRVGEVVLLTKKTIDLNKGTITFYRPKVVKWQTHGLSQRTEAAARNYFKYDAPESECLWRQSIKSNDGRLTVQGLSDRSITQRVATLGESIGIKGLSAHDLRHYWATQAAAAGTPLQVLMDAGGWSSYAMPLRYIEAAKISNKGIRLQ